jgi:hypothetical protein
MESATADLVAALGERFNPFEAPMLAELVPRAAGIARYLVAAEPKVRFRLPA